MTFRHYDLYAQALAKVERGHARDLADVEAMLERGLVDPRASGSSSRPSSRCSTVPRRRPPDTSRRPRSRARLRPG